MISRKMILALSLFVSASSLTGLTASADVDCSRLNLSGKYADPVKGRSRSRETAMTQSGCLVSVYSKDTGAEWHFDLTGETATRVPDRILKANQDSDLGYKTLSSLRIKSKLRTEGYLTDRNFPQTYIDLKAVMLVPDSSSHTTVEIEFNSTLLVSPVSCFTSSGRPFERSECKGLRIDHWENSSAKTTVRAIGVSGGPFVGPLADVFLAGVNFVLKKADGLFDGFLGGFANLERAE
jgi:hypothetical protein